MIVSSIALSLFKRWWPQIVGALLVVGVVAAVLWWDHGRLEDARDEGRAEVQAEFDAYKAEVEAYRAKQEQMVNSLALLWAEAIQKVEVRYVEADTKRAKVFAWFKRRVDENRPATDAVVVRVPAGALSVLHDAHAAANDPRPSAGSADAAEAVPRPASADATPQDTRLTDWILFGLDAAEAYSEARQKWAACVEFVDGIRRGTIPPQTGLSTQTEEPK